MPRHNEHFGSFPENLLNGGVHYNEPELSLRLWPVTPVMAELTWCYRWSKWKAKDSTINICEMLQMNLLCNGCFKTKWQPWRTLDILNKISPVPWHFVKSRFHCSWPCVPSHQLDFRTNLVQFCCLRLYLRHWNCFLLSFAMDSKYCIYIYWNYKFLCCVWKNHQNTYHT